MTNAELPMGWISLAVFSPDPGLLRRQILSIREQTLTDWQCEIGIDGSDLATSELVKGLVLADSRFRVSEFSENVGFYRNFERLLTRVPSGVDWVALSDQDDDWFPNKLELLVPMLEKSSLVLGQAFTVDADRPDEPPVLALRRPNNLAAAMVDNQVTGSLAVFRRDLLEVALPFPVPTDVAYHDHWLGVCALVSDGVKTSTETVQNYVQHRANVIGEERRSSLGSRLAKLRSSSTRGSSSGIAYISEHRWAWRVGMATTILARGPEARADDRAVLAIIAEDRLTLALFLTFVKEVLRGHAPPLRAAALLAGALWAPRMARRNPANGAG